MLSLLTGAYGAEVAGNEVQQYDTFETALARDPRGANPFTEFPSVVFEHDDQRFEVDAFYDGDNTWRARFMPASLGRWRYRWVGVSPPAAGTFDCIANTQGERHGHVRLDPKRAARLRCDDGTAFYWFGGKWLSAPNYGPAEKGDETNSARLTDQQLLAYLDLCQVQRHNGLLLKLALFPLQEDGLSWDLAWIHRAEWLIREMGRRGIYCQVNLFDTWSRARGSWFEHTTDGHQHVFDVWRDGDEDRKANYLRTIVARLAGFYNVWWELGNEMEHAPNPRAGFVAQANGKYLPWIREYDPYGLPIALSEGIWRDVEVDVGLLHQTPETAVIEGDGRRPILLNELVFGWPGGHLYKDATIRDPANRFGYRRTFWRVFASGGCGTGEATWLDIAEPPNQAVLDVMGDQRRLRDFIESLPVDVNALSAVPDLVLGGPGRALTVGAPGDCYVVYCWTSGGGAGDAELVVALPEGVYRTRWYRPDRGEWLEATAGLAGGRRHRLAMPAFGRDIVLLIARETVAR